MPPPGPARCPRWCGTSPVNTHHGANVKTGDQIVQNLPWRWGVQGRIFIIGGLGYLFDAYDIALNGFLMPLLGEHFDLSLIQRGLVATANLVGMAVGAVAWGAVADRIGRKKAFSVTLLVFGLFSVLGALSPTTWSSSVSGSWRAPGSAAVSRWTTPWWASSRRRSTADGSSPPSMCGGRSV